MYNDRSVIAHRARRSGRRSVMSSLLREASAPLPHCSRVGSDRWFGQDSPVPLMPQLILNRAEQRLQIKGLREGVSSPE